MVCSLTNRATPAGSYSLTVTAAGLLNGTQTSRTATVTMQVLGAGVTTLAGQVRDEDDKPVKGALVKLGSLQAPTAQTATDDGGNFLLQNAPAGANQLFFIDGGPASTTASVFALPSVILKSEIFLTDGIATDLPSFSKTSRHGSSTVPGPANPW